MSSKRPSKHTVQEPGSHRERELRSRVNDLEEENRLIRQRLHEADPLNAMDPEWARLVEQFTQVMLELDTLCDPRSSNPIEAQTRYKRADSSADEGAPTRWARELRNRIRRAVRPLLSEYQGRVDGTWQPPESVPKVRCRNSHCRNEGKRIPQFVGPGRTVELSRCPECDHALSPG